MRNGVEDQAKNIDKLFCNLGKGQFINMANICGIMYSNIISAKC
jgi:hypothetical protein